MEDSSLSCRGLVPVDRERIHDELSGIQAIFSPVQNPDFLAEQLPRFIKRLRALLPVDLDLAMGAGRVGMERLRDFLDELTAVYHLDEAPTQRPPAARIGRLADMLASLIREFRPREGGTSPAAAEMPLSEWEQKVDQLIRDKGPLSGKEICLAIGIEIKVLYNHVVPALKRKRGLSKQGQVGYFYP